MLSISLGGVHFHWHSAKAERAEEKAEKLTVSKAPEKFAGKTRSMTAPVIIEPHIVENGVRRKASETESIQMLEDVRSDKISDAELDSWVWKWEIENERPIMKVYWDRHI